MPAHRAPSACTCPAYRGPHARGLAACPIGRPPAGPLTVDVAAAAGERCVEWLPTGFDPPIARQCVQMAPPGAPLCEGCQARRAHRQQVTASAVPPVTPR